MPGATSPPGGRSVGGEMSNERRGVLFGIAAYAIWGLFPLYFTLLQPSGALKSWPTAACGAWWPSRCC